MKVTPRYSGGRWDTQKSAQRTDVVKSKKRKKSKIKKRKRERRKTKGCD